MTARTDALVRYAYDMRANRTANPGVGGDGTALELLLAPRMQHLVENALTAMLAAPGSCRNTSAPTSSPASPN